MCGVAGLFLPRNVSPKKVDMTAMLRAMNHRGPDGEGRYETPDGRYQAGFRRLAIIDLETGGQPLVEEGTGRVLTGNGEIYNYLEIKDAHPDYPYRTRGDMETVLALRRARGESFVHGLNGIYALALYEGDAHRLLLVRDRLGVKPLYWAEIPGGGVLFASEIKALMASGLIGRAVNEKALGAQLAHGYVPAPDTFYEGIKQLPPGHLLRAGADGAISVERYWRPRPADGLPEDRREVAAHLSGLLSDSIRLQLRSDVPVGALLSGGIDSGLMVALAAERASRPLNTFTVRFEGAPHDESPLAEEVARRYATNHRVVDLPAATAGDHLARLAWYAEGPLNDPALLPNYLIEEALGRDLKVALNGTGGDELFAGYGRYFQTPVEKRYLGLPGPLRRGLVEPLVAAASPMTAWRLARAEKFDRDPGGYLHDHTTFFPEPMRRLIGNAMDGGGAEQARFAEGIDAPRQTKMLHADLCTYLPGDLLDLLDRTSMAAGVEGRVPFLDHRLVEAALAVPPAIRTPGDAPKALEREMARPYLPKSVIDAPKRGFASPVPAWIEAGLGETARRILTRKQTLERGWWTGEGISRLFGDPKRHAFRIYHLLMLELAVRIHVENPPRTDPPGGGLEDFADAS